MISTLFFDCDGVLIDSEPIHFKAHAQALQNHGITLTEEEYLANGVSTSSIQFYEKMAIKHNMSVDPNVVHIEKGRIYTTLTQSVTLFPGVIEIITNLATRYTLYIVSSSHKDTIANIPALRGILPYFQGIISTHDVPRGKPFPDVYLKAVEVSQMSPQTCVAIEDSVTGVRAAIAANLRCIAIPNRLTKQQDLSTASFQISNIQELSDRVIQSQG